MLLSEHHAVVDLAGAPLPALGQHGRRRAQPRLRRGQPRRTRCGPTTVRRCVRGRWPPAAGTPERALRSAPCACRSLPARRSRDRRRPRPRRLLRLRQRLRAPPRTPRPPDDGDRSGLQLPRGRQHGREEGRPAAGDGRPRTGEVAVTITTSAGDIKADPRRRRDAVHGELVRLAGRAGLLRRHPLPPADHAATGIYVLQCGDPTGTGTGGPGYSFDDELTGDETYPAGTLAMANAGPNTNGSQFFIVYGDTPLPPNYTVFGTDRRRRPEGRRGGRREGHRRPAARDGPPEDSRSTITDGHRRRLIAVTQQRERRRPVSSSDAAHSPRARSGSSGRRGCGRPRSASRALPEAVGPDEGVAGHVHRGGVQRGQRALPHRHPGELVAPAARPRS